MDNCPKCNTSFIGDLIPEKDQQFYSGTHWRREIGIDGGRLGIYDGLVAYKCCDCGHIFPRGDSEWAQEMFSKFMEACNEEKRNIRRD